MTRLFTMRLFLLLSVLGLLFACSEDDTTMVDEAPNAVSNLSATPKNQAVLLEWTNPTDEDLSKLTIKYGNAMIDVATTENSYLIEGLTNKTEYSFDVLAVDEAGQESQIMNVKVTPDQYVSVYEGKDYVAGLYKDTDPTDSYATEVEIGNANNTFKRTFATLTNGNQFVWEGTLAKNADDTFTYDYEYYGIRDGQKDHVAYLKVTTNAVLSFDFNDITRFANEVYEKVDGDADFIEGTYESYRNTTSTDQESYNSNYDFSYEFKSDGSVSKIYAGNETESTWTNQDLLDEKYIFVKYNSKTYLIVNPAKYLAKQ